MTLQAWPYPALFAHRGGGYLAPENTLPGMAEAVARGFHAVEFDVKLSSDNHTFLLHDDSIDRTSNGRGLAARMTLAELQQADAGSWHGSRFAGTVFPRFAEVARYCQQHGLLANVEIKPCPGRDRETGEQVAREAAQLWAGQPVPPLLSSFSWEALVAARDAAPHLPRGWLVEEWPEDWEARLRELGCLSFNCDYLILTAERVAVIKAAGYRVMAYTVNDADRARELLSWGVDGLFTDALDSLREAILRQD